jgi:hypothetical protein
MRLHLVQHLSSTRSVLLLRLLMMVVMPLRLLYH